MARKSARVCALLPCLLVAACGSDKPVKQKTFDPATYVAKPVHDYSTTWVYTVGEVDSPAKADCLKASGFIVGEAPCIGRACQRAAQLSRDFDFACKKLLTPEEQAESNRLAPSLAERAREPATPCIEQIETLLAKGCGEDGACEPRAQRWATQCAATTQSKLYIHLLERQIENSLLEPRRVKLDTRSCEEFAKVLDEAASCSKPFDCEDALPKVDQYVIRCAQGKRKAVPLAQALSLLRIQLGAEKPVNSIALVGERAKLPAIAGTQPLVDGTGVVYRVCDEAPGELPAYLEQRAACKDGNVTLLRSLSSSAGYELRLLTVPHDSDSFFKMAYPKFWVEGESALRSELALKAFATAVQSLPARAMEDFTAAIAAVSRAFAELPPKIRQSDRVAQALSPNDEALVPLFALIGESKVRVAGTKLDDQELLSLLHRSEALVFADMTPSGNVEIDAISDLSELVTRDALPKSFAAYDKRLDKLRKLVQKRKLDPTMEDLDAGGKIADLSQQCAATRKKLGETQSAAESCLSTETPCDTDKRRELGRSLESSRGDWYKARVREIVAKASAAQPVIPSKECTGP